MDKILDFQLERLTSPETGLASLQLDGLTCERGGRPLFRNINRQLRPGDLLRVQGANGAGKTSLLRMLCGLLEPSQGHVLWNGQKICTLREDFSRELVFLGHAAALKDDLSPLENLQVACLLGGERLDTRAARQALDDAGLRGHHHTPVRRLSQGQRKRSALARLSLANRSSHHPRLWVLDEPFNALDDKATLWLTNLIRAHLQRAGIVVLTSHQDVALDSVSQQELAL